MRGTSVTTSSQLDSSKPSASELRVLILGLRAFRIAQVAFEFECNQRNGNSADLWSTELQIGLFRKR